MKLFDMLNLISDEQIVHIYHAGDYFYGGDKSKIPYEYMNHKVKHIWILDTVGTVGMPTACLCFDI